MALEQKAALELDMQDASQELVDLQQQVRRPYRRLIRDAANLGGIDAVSMGTSGVKESPANTPPINI